jgi:hypothetical protein
MQKHTRHTYRQKRETCIPKRPTHGTLPHGVADASRPTGRLQTQNSTQAEKKCAQQTPQRRLLMGAAGAKKLTHAVQNDVHPLTIRGLQHRRRKHRCGLVVDTVNSANAAHRRGRGTTDTQPAGECVGRLKGRGTGGQTNRRGKAYPPSPDGPSRPADPPQRMRRTSWQTPACHLTPPRQ